MKNIEGFNDETDKKDHSKVDISEQKRFCLDAICFAAVLLKEQYQTTHDYGKLTYPVVSLTSCYQTGALVTSGSHGPGLI